jgi:hypothetical protein
MRDINFDLKFVLFTTTIISILAWGGADEYHPLRLLICVVLVACASAEYAIIQKSRPHFFAAFNSGLAVVVLSLLWGPVRAAVYLYRDGPNTETIHEDFFEDGLEFVMFTVPTMLIYCFAIPAALVGLVCSGVVSLGHRTLKQILSETER